MSQDYAGVSRTQVKRALLDDLSVLYDFAIPEGMVESEFEAIWKHLMEDREKNELDPSDIGRSDDELRQDYRGVEPIKKTATA